MHNVGITFKGIDKVVSSVLHIQRNIDKKKDKELLNLSFYLKKTVIPNQMERDFINPTPFTKRSVRFKRRTVGISSRDVYYLIYFKHYSSGDFATSPSEYLKPHVLGGRFEGKRRKPKGKIESGSKATTFFPLHKSFKNAYGNLPRSNYTKKLIRFMMKQRAIFIIPKVVKKAYALLVDTKKNVHLMMVRQAEYKKRFWFYETCQRGARQFGFDREIIDDVVNVFTIRK